MAYEGTANRSSRRTGGRLGHLCLKLQVSGGGRRLCGEQQSLEKEDARTRGVPLGKSPGFRQGSQNHRCKRLILCALQSCEKILFAAGKRAMVWCSKAWHRV